MMDNIVKKLRKMKNFVNVYGESIPVVAFDELGLKDLRSLTPYKVGQVLANTWLPDGMIAWHVAESSNKLSLVFFRGKAAVVTERSIDGLNLDDILKEASTLISLDSKKIVSMCA